MKWVQWGLNITRIDQLLLWEGSVLVAIVLSFVSAVAPLRRLHVIKTFTKKNLFDFIFLEILGLPFQRACGFVVCFVSSLSVL